MKRRIKRRNCGNCQTISGRIPAIAIKHYFVRYLRDGAGVLKIMHVPRFWRQSLNEPNFQENSPAFLYCLLFSRESRTTSSLLETKQKRRKTFRCVWGLSPRTHGNVFLRFRIVYCSEGNREQPAHFLKQYKNAEKLFRVYGALSQ